MNSEYLYRKISDAVAVVEAKYLRKYARNQDLARRIFDDVREIALLQVRADKSLNEEPWDLHKGALTSLRTQSVLNRKKLKRKGN